MPNVADPFSLVADQLYRHRCRLEIVAALEEDSADAKVIADTHHYAKRYVVASLYRDSCIGICRVFDPAKTGKYINLTLETLLNSSPSDASASAKLSEELRVYRAETLKVLFELRNKWFAHNDLDSWTLSIPSTPSVKELVTHLEWANGWLSRLRGSTRHWSVLDARSFVRDLAAGARLHHESSIG